MFVTVTLSLPRQHAAEPRSYTMLNPALPGVSFGCSRRGGVPSLHSRSRKTLLPLLPGERGKPPPQGGGWSSPLLGLGSCCCLADRWRRASLLDDYRFLAVETCAAELWGECRGWRRGKPLRLSGGACQRGTGTVSCCYSGADSARGPGIAGCEKVWFLGGKG